MAPRVLAHLPLTVADLTTIADGGSIADLPAYVAATAPDARPDESEAAEFDALCDAAAASVQRILDTDGLPRRVVAVAEIDQARVAGSGDDARLDVLRRSDLLAVYVDADAVGDDVQALIAAAASGSEPTEAQYDAVETALLLWHHPDEIDELAAGRPNS